MANYFVMFSAPEKYIKFMLKHPGVSRDYYMGEQPSLEPMEPQKLSFIDKLLGRKIDNTTPDSIEIPEDWPESEPEVIDIEINHRNVDLYHWILNKTSKPVEGAGSIFQTWFHTKHAALSLDNYNEDFAFLPEKIPELLLLVEAVTPESLRDSFHEWCKKKGKDHVPSINEAREMHKEFINFKEYLKNTINKNHGLVWVVS